MKYIIGHKKPDVDSVVSALSLKYLFDNKPCFSKEESRAVLADPANRETEFVFDKFNTKIPKVLNSDEVENNDNFVLVDHNEESQRLNGVEDNQITDIFDHHKLSLNLNKTISVTTKPWGSTTTIVWYLMQLHNVDPDKNLAGLMICAILSDTVGLKSATTTEKDKKAVEKLNKIVQIDDLKDLTFNIFKAKSSIKGLSNEELVKKDYKVYDFAGQKVFINQIETVEQDKVLKKSEELIKTIYSVKKEMNLDKAYVLVTDILKVNSKIIALENDQQVIESAFPKAEKLAAGIFDIGPKMSRKKEVAPVIEKVLS